MQGNEACAEGAIAAGANFFAGYPITPATEIAEVMSKRLPMEGGKFIQMEDELACMGAVVGASLAGSKAMTASSGPGFTLLQENIGYAIMTEVPCVIVNIQRGGPSTGLPTLPSQSDVMQSRWGTHGDHPIIVLSPSTVEEMFYITVECFNLAERYRMPVMLLSDAVIGHLREKVTLPDYSTIDRAQRAKPTCPPAEYLPYSTQENGVPLMANIGDGYRHYITGCVHDRKGLPALQNTRVAEELIARLHDKIDRNGADIIRTESAFTGDASTVVMAYGCTARSAKQAVMEARADGLKVGYFRPITIWPFPEDAFIKAVSEAHTIIIPEMNMGQFADVAMSVLYKAGLPRKSIVKIMEIGSVMIHPDRIRDAITEAM